MEFYTDVRKNEVIKLINGMTCGVSGWIKLEREGDWKSDDTQWLNNNLRIIFNEYRNVF